MINERKLTPSELEKREKVIMKMKGNKRDLVKKYGKDAEAVMYGRATNMAKKKTENMRNSKLTELIKDALKNPKKADLDKDGKLSSYEKTRGAAIEKNISEDDDLESGQYGDPKVGNYDITSQNDNEAGDIEALSAAGLEEDIDIGHEDNEPGMLQGDLYQIGKSAMEIYELLDAMEGQGEVDLPSWWQSKIFKAKEAIVGASEYLEFELKEPAIDAVVDTVAPLDIEVDPLGETVEDEITSVDDMTENQKIASKLAKRLKEDKDWIQKAIKRPGALHRALDIPQDKDIPDSLIDKDIRKMDKEEDKEGKLDKKDLRFLRQLDLAKTLEKFDENVTENVSENEYFSYLNDLRDSGQTNMFDVKMVEILSGLEKEEIMTIMKSYGELKEKYDE